MRRSLPAATVLGLVLSVGLATVAMAHGGSGEATIEVEPGSVTAGDVVVLAGSGLEPDSDRVLVLAGADLTVELGTVKTDAEGMFSKELTIPNHLPSGTYELRAIGDETLTAPLAVTAAETVAGASSAPSAAGEQIVARQRVPLELGIIIGFVAVSIALGGWLIWRAERFRGTPTA